MNRILLVTPVFRRFGLTRIMLEHRRLTFDGMPDDVECGCVVVGDDDENLAVADSLGFATIQAENVLGSKYNDGHQYAVDNGWDISLQCNSDQVFTPGLLTALAKSPRDKFIRTTWLTFIHAGGKKCLSFRNLGAWALTAYSTEMLKEVPRPCDEGAMRMCDTLTHLGVLRKFPGAAMHTVETGPLEAVQFESGFQLTPWKKNLHCAMLDGQLEKPVPWMDLGQVYGKDLMVTMQQFYGIR